MEEKEKYEKLKLILDCLEKAVTLYNELNPQEKVTITPQVAKKDVSDIFICFYNHKHVGLFEKLNHCFSQNYYYNDRYKAGSIYVGVDSNYVGMELTYNLSCSDHRWEKIGTKRKLNGQIYVSNCVIQDCMSFDDMRLIMYNEGKIGPYEIGKASSQEMVDVLRYALNYYQLVQSIKKTKSK